MSAVAPHLHPISIVPEDIDFMGHVNNARYLGWVQDAVLGHWNAFAPAEAVATRVREGDEVHAGGGAGVAHVVSTHRADAEDSKANTHVRTPLLQAR